MPFFFKGAILGFLIAAPVGPIGLLCITRTLRSGFFAGFASGLGAATADVMYGSIAALGLTAVINALTAIAIPLHAAGACILCWMGVKTLRSRGVRSVAQDERTLSAPAAYASAVVLTLLNPATIISFLSIFAAALGTRPTIAGGSLIVAGMFVGSTLWWLVLATAVAMSRRYVTGAIERAIDVASGLLLIGFAVVALM